MIQQFAWVLEVRPGYEDEYKKRHEEIWPEMVDMLQNAGVRNYSIFRHGLTLFGYLKQTTWSKQLQRSTLVMLTDAGASI